MQLAEDETTPVRRVIELYTQYAQVCMYICCKKYVSFLIEGFLHSLVIATLSLLKAVFRRRTYIIHLFQGCIVGLELFDRRSLSPDGGLCVIGELFPAAFYHSLFALEVGHLLVTRLSGHCLGCSHRARCRACYYQSFCLEYVWFFFFEKGKTTTITITNRPSIASI